MGQCRCVFLSNIQATSFVHVLIPEISIIFDTYERGGRLRNENLSKTQ